MANQLSLRHLRIRPMGAMATRRSFPHKWAVVDGHLSIVDPAPGHTYVREAKGQGHEYSWPPVGRGKGESLYSARRIEAKLRAFQALSLWQQGATWEEVAAKLGFADKSGPWRAVRRLHDRADYNEWLKQELKRYG